MFFSLTFDQFNTSLLNKSIHVFKKSHTKPKHLSNDETWLRILISITTVLWYWHSTLWKVSHGQIIRYIVL